MQLYFAASIAGGRKYLETCQKIVYYLQGQGHVIPTEHVVAVDVLHQESGLSAREIYNRDLHWLKDSDALIAEVSNPSLGVGYEIGYALQIGLPVLCLYDEKVFLSRMISGNSHPDLTVLPYKQDEDWRAILDAFLAQIAG